MNYRKQSQQKGFTLIELLVVITIIGLLASTVLASLSNSRSLARDASRVTAVKEFQKALELYRNANAGNYPCATAMPGCAGNAAAGVAINTATANMVIGAGSVLFNYFKPSVETQMPSIAVLGSASFVNTTASIAYRVGSTAGNETLPDRNTYTILLRREQAIGALPANSWCTISIGSGHSAWTGAYPQCF